MELAAKKASSKRRRPLRDTSARKETTPSLSKEYQVVFENSGKAMVIVEKDATISLANAEFEKLSGYTKEEIEGKKSWTEFVVRDDRRRVKEYHLLRRTDPILAPRSFAFRLLDRQNKVKNIVLTIGQIPGTNKSMASLLDVTDRGQAEETAQRNRKASTNRVESQTAELVRANEALQEEIADLKREVERLRESEERNRTLIDNIDMGINLIDSDHNIVMTNAAQGKQFNKPISEMIGKKCFQEFEKRDAVCPQCPGIQAMATGKPAEVETQGVRDDGSCYHARIQAFPVFRQDGTVSTFIETSEDITERKQMEELLRQERETFISILEHTLYGVVLVDRDGKHVYVNPAFTAITGYTLEDIPTGKDWMHKAYPDKAYQQKVTEFWRKDSKLGGTMRVISVVCKNGETKDIEFRSTVLDDGRTVAMLTDITERKKTEKELQRAYEELKDSEQRYRTLVENMSHKINLIDSDHTILTVNAAQSKELNKPVSELIGKKCFREFAKRDAVCPDCPGVQTMATGNSAEIEVEGVRDDGTHYHARVQAFPVFGEDGTAAGFIEVAEDITERKQMEETLRESQKELQTLMDTLPVAISWADLQENVKYINHKFHELFGYTLEDIPTIAEWRRQADQDPAQRERFARWGEELIEARKHGTPLPPREMTVTCKDGSSRYVTVEGRVVSNRNLVIYNDITERKRMEENLRESEERFRLLVEHSKDAIFLHEFGKIVDVNQYACDSLGYTREELLNLSIRDIDEDVRRGKHKETWEQMVPGVPITVEGTQRRKDGTTFPIEVRLVAFESGGRKLMLGLVRDVTERKQMEETLRRAYEELKESEARYRTLVDNVDLGINLIDVNHTIVMLNAAESKLFNKSVSEMIGKKCFREFEKRDAVCSYCPGVQAMATGKPAEVEIEGAYDDGSPYMARMQAFPIFGHDGHVTGFIGVTENITERKQIEEELRINRMHLADAMDMARIAYWEADHQAKEFMLNDAFYALYGTTVEAEGSYRMPFEKFVQRFIHPDDRAIFGQVNEDIEKNTDQEQILYHEHRFIHGNGEIRYIGIRSRVFRDDSGNIIRTFGANQDITERKRAEERLKHYAAELEQSNEEVKNFAYIVSHDLRVPLVNLKGYSAELRSALEVIRPTMETALPYLKEDKRSAVAMALHEDVPEALEFIINSVSRMDSFINSVLILSRLGRRELKHEPIDMNALVQTTLENLSHQIQTLGIKVTVASLPQVVADRTAMEQIMGNILGNAVKYLDPERPGQIEVTAQANNGEQIFRIRDNGRGIAQEDMHKIFTPFRRAGKQDTPGEGMGLAYVQTLVRRQGGRIWCESELGKGTTFTFTISQHRAEGGAHVTH